MPTPLKIAVYTIALNEEQFAQTWAASAAEADYRVVADTGSTDGTVERLRGLGVTVHSIAVKPWRFDRARDASLALVPADADICVAMDMDEKLRPGWRERLLKAWKPGVGGAGGTNRFRYSYIWSWHNGKPLHMFAGDKIHGRFSHQWRYPAHETLVPLRVLSQVYAADAELIMEHHPDNTKSRGGYLALLKLGAEEDPHDGRMAHYYGRELLFANRHAEAITEIHRHLALPSTWSVERALSMLNLAWCYSALGDVPKAERWMVAAAEEAPGWRDPWVELAQLHHNRKDWLAGWWAAERALAIQRQTSEVPMNAANWGSRPWDLAAACAWNAGNGSRALVCLTKAVELSPDNEELRKNLEGLKAALGKGGGTGKLP